MFEEQMVFDILLVPLLRLLAFCLRTLQLLIITSWIVDILFLLNVLNRNSMVIYSIRDLLTHIIEPLVRPIRRLIPPRGMFDFSLLILLLWVEFLYEVMRMIIIKYGVY